MEFKSQGRRHVVVTIENRHEDILLQNSLWLNNPRSGTRLAEASYPVDVRLKRSELGYLAFKTMLSRNPENVANAQEIVSFFAAEAAPAETSAESVLEEPPAQQTPVPSDI